MSNTKENEDGSPHQAPSTVETEQLINAQAPIEKADNEDGSAHQAPSTLGTEQLVNAQVPIEKADNYPPPPNSDTVEVDVPDPVENGNPSPQVEEAADKSTGELNSSPQQPHQESTPPSPSDDEKCLGTPEIESMEDVKANGNSDLKPETCADNGIAIPSNHIETAKPTVDTENKPSDISQDSPGGDPGAVPEESNEPAAPQAGSSDVEDKVDDKRESNDIDTSTPKTIGKLTPRRSFLLDENIGGSESGTEEEQKDFLSELHTFFSEKGMEFKPPKFYGDLLNCLKLWRSVMRLGGYDTILLRLAMQFELISVDIIAGDCFLALFLSFLEVVSNDHLPGLFLIDRTCTTVSWTFRGFYEKVLLDYERHITIADGGELSIVIASKSEPKLPKPPKLPKSEPKHADNKVTFLTGKFKNQFPTQYFTQTPKHYFRALESPSIEDSPSTVSHARTNLEVGHPASGSGRTRRDAAARAMQGWHSLRFLGNGEVSSPIVKDKNSIPVQKREKELKNLGSLKRKKPSYVEHAVKSPHAKSARLDVEVTDVGTPADWVKINVQKTEDSFEVYALVPGLLREEVRVQSDPAGRVVISGEPEHEDNPWGVAPFKKVVSLPSRIDPHLTTAVVTLHGQLYVRVPFGQQD
ncbi:hypothetical protein DKX38_017954 [Salix brachista]|uniref:SHSP domain-containing protein n=1 Tax=Salix brachista TaxID=2182728 RepID=A0A5N5KXG5_9ROSI|nr:hypothetical protein DKX38_017954 [Salix brachista]